MKQPAHTPKKKTTSKSKKRKPAKIRPLYLGNSPGIHNLNAKDNLLSYGFIMVPHSISCITELTLSDKFVLGYLLDCIREGGGGRCFPSAATIAKVSGIGVRTVGDAIVRLRKLGFLTWTSKYGSSSEYLLGFPAWAIQKYRKALQIPLQILQTPSADSADPLCRFCIPPLQILQTKHTKEADQGNGPRKRTGRPAETKHELGGFIRLEDTL